MAYSPVSYYVSRGAEYGNTGAGGLAAGKVDVRREESSLEEKYEPARKQLEKSKEQSGWLKTLGSIGKGLVKFGLLTGKIAPTPLTLGLTAAGYGLSQMAPGLKGGLLGGDIDLPDIAHKYKSTEKMEDLASSAIGDFEESVGWAQAGIKGLGTLFDLYMTGEQKELMDLYKSSLKEPGPEILKPDIFDLFSSTGRFELPEQDNTIFNFLPTKGMPESGQFPDETYY
jgi:hypothetical protein